MNGRVALVTGAGTGIGQAIALSLASRGATVWLVGRRAARLTETAARGERSRGELWPYPADITEDRELAGLRDAVLAGGGGLHILVHSAGTIAHGPLERARIADLDAQYRANLRAPYMLTQTLLAPLRESRGDVVFVNSTAALGARPDVGQFAATQAGLRAVADSVRSELNPQHVRVLSVFPGRTATARQERIHAHEGRDYRPEQLMQSDDVAAMVVAALDLPRTAEVKEIVMRPFARPA